jgi:hypothetical protein
MQETRVVEMSQIQETKSTVKASKSTSGFNDAEYQRWSENLRNRNKSKNK